MTEEHSVEGGIDPRGPRFGATVTSMILLVALFFTLTTGSSVQRASIANETVLGRFLEPGTLIFTGMFLVFLWGSIAGIKKHPFGLLFRVFIRPRLRPAAILEHPTPPTFAQGVGAFVVGVGLILHLAGVPWALTLAGAAAFLSAFLNAAFGFCLGCELYLLIWRVRFLRPRKAA